MAFGAKKDTVKTIPVSLIPLPSDYEPFFRNETVMGCYKGIRDLVIFTDVRVVSVDVQGITGKQKVMVSIPYTHICEMMIETSGYLDMDTDLYLQTTAGNVMAYSFKNGNEVVNIQNCIVLKMR